MENKYEDKIVEFLGKEVKFDEYCGKIVWAVGEDGGHQRLADLEVRGWGGIQNIFKDRKGKVDMERAAEFQDELGCWLADAINTKLQKAKKQ